MVCQDILDSAASIKTKFSSNCFFNLSKKQFLLIPTDFAVDHRWRCRESMTGLTELSFLKMSHDFFSYLIGAYLDEALFSAKQPEYKKADGMNVIQNFQMVPKCSTFLKIIEKNT